MQDRIDRLESLVLSLMNNGGQVTGPAAAVAAMSGSRSAGSTDLASPQMQDDEMQGRNRDEDSEVERVSNSIGVMKVQNDRHFFVSEAHWFAILSDVSCTMLFTANPLANVMIDFRSQKLFRRSQKTI